MLTAGEGGGSRCLYPSTA